MPRRARIKSKIVRATIQNKDVLDMFNGVLGGDPAGKPNYAITWDKYKRIRHHSDRFVQLIRALATAATLQHFPDEARHIATYAATLRNQHSAVFISPDLDQYLDPVQVQLLRGGSDVDVSTILVPDFGRAPEEEKALFARTFSAAKRSNLVNVAVKTCSNLVAQKHFIGELDKLDPKFLTHSGGLSYCPLPDLPAANFKSFYNDGRLDAADRRFLLLVLHKLYAISHEVYEAVSAPDIDVDAFAEYVMASLDKVRKHIPRCNEAFDKIADSVQLLKGNFNGYYRDFVASNNPTVILENFVLDVSRDTKSSVRITSQFRRIIKHYRKLAQQQTGPGRSQMQALFQQVDKNFQELERHGPAGAAAYDAAELCAADDSAEEAPPGAPARAEEQKEKPDGLPSSEDAESAGGAGHKKRKAFQHAAGDKDAQGSQGAPADGSR